MVDLLSKKGDGAYYSRDKEVGGIDYKEIIGEFWTSKQRQANSLHEISYRACFKPQLPGFFIEKFTKKGDVVYDPFLGRGTTILEAALRGRGYLGNDINPLSQILVEPRLDPPCYDEVEKRLQAIPFDETLKADIDLSMFYHPKTEAAIVSLRNYFLSKELDKVDRWIRMVATNRLTGHSKGFFSVYTLPPNQATTPQRQREINQKRGQTPEYRDVKALILKKTKALLKNVGLAELAMLKGVKGELFCEDARNTLQIEDESVDLVVTSPPFLNVVQYSKDNWLRCWFNGIDVKSIEKRIFVTSSLELWKAFIEEVFIELYRIVKRGGVVAFEVGEVKGGTIKLDEELVPIAKKVGFAIECVMVNVQAFTKTSNIWGIYNNKRGTNSNRILVLRK